MEKKNKKSAENADEAVNNEATEAENNAVDEKIEELEKRCADATDKYLRVLAEYDNFRKRTMKERDGIYAEAYTDAVKQLLPIIDNVERSLEYSSDEKFLEGMKLIIASIHTTLEKMGVKEIETKTFDPNLHNAVMHIDDESYGEGEIIEVFQKGYIMGERVIRYAMVKVAN